MLLALAVACAPKAEDPGPSPAFTSDERAEIVIPGSSTCVDGELSPRIGFAAAVPRVEAEIRNGTDVVELHDVPFAGMDEDTETIFIHEADLTVGAGEAVSGQATTFTCEDGAYAGFRVYDDEGGIMACSFGEWVIDEFDTTACPAEE